MSNVETRDEVLREVEALGLIDTPRRARSAHHPGAETLEGEITVAGHTATIQLVLDRSFPRHLPRFYLIPWDALGFIPHVDPIGQICYLDPEGLVLDRRRPTAIVVDAIQCVKNTLMVGVTGANQADFADEWEVYWRQLPGVGDGLSLLDPSVDITGPIVIPRDGGTLLWITPGRDEIDAFFNGVNAVTTKEKTFGLYVPLEPGAYPTPPRPDKPFWTAEDVRRELLPHMSAGNTERLHKMTKRQPRGTEYVVFRLPHRSGGATLFGIRYDQVSGAHPLRPDGSAKRTTPLALQRLDRGYLVERGGGTRGLGRKRVLIIGCGAVGGHVALELARAGISKLTLVDFDTLTPENTFRHVVGRNHWWRLKVEALKATIESQFPFSDVTAVGTSIEAALAAGAFSLNNFDLIVCALGKPTVELELNERIQALSERRAAIFTWLEPFGIGGHALLTGNGCAGGCFECLYTPDDGEEGIIENRAAFAGRNQQFGRALSGCGSLHTPYGSADAVQTALLATRLAVDALTGGEAGNPLLSWKGEARAFLAAGYRVSDRFGATIDQLNHQRYAYYRSHCPICGGRTDPQSVEVPVDR